MAKVRVSIAIVLGLVGCVDSGPRLESTAQAELESDQLPADGLQNQSLHNAASLRSRGFRSRIGQGHTNSGTQFLDTLPQWNGHFATRGYDQNGQLQQVWYYNMLGNRPELGGTTTINAPLIAVNIDLRNADGSPRFVNGQRLFSSATPLINPALESPVFELAQYSSRAVPTQFTDAVMRAEFANVEQGDWHTLLAPSVKTTRTMVLNRGTYQFALNPDGTCCRFILVDADAFTNALFPATLGDTSAIIGQAQHDGEITQHDFSTFLFPNTFLYLNGNPGDCCVGGFHSFDFEPVGNIGAGQAYVMNYSSWISPGIFRGASDVTAFSHEVAEAYNDPLVSFDGVHDITPWWLAPNGLCQNNLETGDVIEGLPDATYPMTMPNGFTYHPQNEALLPWFAFQTPSTALDHAYSYPNESVLAGPSAFQNPGCQ